MADGKASSNVVPNLYLSEPCYPLCFNELCIDVQLGIDNLKGYRPKWQNDLACSTSNTNLLILSAGAPGPDDVGT